MIETLNIILIIFMLITAFAATRSQSLVGSAFLMGAFGFFLATLWSVLSAPDVSFTEAVVGAGVSTIFLLLALLGSKHSVAERKSSQKSKLPLLVILFLGAVIFYFSMDLPELGLINSPASQHLSPYYLQHAYHDSKTPNVVTAVVVDYRSFDTLIEAAVVFTAGVACLLIFREEDQNS